jgi:hypothetical protein
MRAASTESAARRRLFLLILIVIPVACAIVVLLFSSRTTHERRGRLIFSGTTIGAFATNQSAPGAVTEVPDPTGGRQKVLALTVHDDDVAPVTPTENPRAQLLSPPLIKPGRTFWLSTAFLIPQSLPRVSTWLTLTSVYGPPAFGSGPWDIALDDVRGHGNLLMLRRGDEYRYDIPWAIPVPRGRWTTVVVHERFARHGFLELWVNGQRVTFFADSPYDPLHIGPTKRLPMATRGDSNGAGTNVAKIMQYRQRGQFQVGTVYFAGLWLGSSREAVEFPTPR